MELASLDRSRASLARGEGREITQEAMRELAAPALSHNWRTTTNGAPEKLTSILTTWKLPPAASPAIGVVRRRSPVLFASLRAG